jgi:NADH dehydrogenase FAD-containing subunit
MFTKILIVAKIFISALPLIFERIGQVIEARIHQYTYNASDNPRNIIVIGGSFGGLFLATELANSIPTGYRVVLIEKRSHFNFTWIFPRVSVVTDHEHKAFIPYGPIIAGVPEGSLKFIRGVAVMINESSVTLMDGTVVEFEYLAVATGTTGSPPWCAATEEKREGMENFRRMQREIRDAKDFVVVGGGAVGVELAADAKCMYPEMNVSLIHSRSSLLNSFGPKLHDYSMKILNELGVNVHLGERVSDEEAAIGIPSTVTLKSGRIIPYDLLVSQNIYPK